jgi:RNA polymerase sigma factor (sigma-70 family)
MDNLAQATDHLAMQRKARVGTPFHDEGQNKDRRFSALMRAAQDGDRAAYSLLLKEIAPILKRLVQNRLRFMASADREDVVQDILLALHAARATYDPNRPFMPWLMSIGHNRIVDVIRRRVRQNTNEVLVDELPTAIGDDSGGHERDHRAVETLQKAIKALPTGQKTAIELVKMREMSLKDAAQISGMSISALKVSAHRAIKSLRASFDA